MSDYMLIKSFQNKYSLHMVTLLLFAINLFIGYPGSLAGDSLFQYQQALKREFFSQNPVMMAWVWSLFMNITKNPVTMLIFHLVLLWCSVYNFASSFENKKIKWFFPIIGITPLVLNYSIIILKDVSFAFSYLLAGSILTKVTLANNKIKPLQLLIVLAALCYGTGVKFQAIMILPFFTTWTAYLIYKPLPLQIERRIFSKKVVLLSILLFASFFASKEFLTKSLSKGGDNFWQMVKLYDLAAISIATNHLYFPDYVTKHPNFDHKKLKERFNHEYVDRLIFSYPDGPPILLHTDDNILLKQLVAAWRQAILEHPFYYLEHRFLISWNMVKRRYNIMIHPDWTANPPEYAVKMNELKLLTYKYNLFFRTFSGFIWLLPFMAISLLVGLKTYARDKDHNGLPLIMLNLSSLTLLACLMFFSMASEARYLLLCQLNTYFSLPLAYLCMQNLRKSKKRVVINGIA
jgi:hypothetical protein